MPYECYHNVSVWMMGGISEEGILGLENQMKAENCKILLLIHNCWSLLVFHVSQKTLIAAAIAIWFL